ncbi:unnamed protein product, partial [Mesorhabditis spiculigera]
MMHEEEEVEAERMEFILSQKPTRKPGSKYGRVALLHGHSHQHEQELTPLPDSTTFLDLPGLLFGSDDQIPPIYDADNSLFTHNGAAVKEEPDASELAFPLRQPKPEPEDVSTTELVFPVPDPVTPQLDLEKRIFIGDNEISNSLGEIIAALKLRFPPGDPDVWMFVSHLVEDPANQ